MATETVDRTFVNSVIEEIIKPGIQRLMETRYFSELREGALSIRRLQGFALQHYAHNIAINKGFALSMVKNAHNPEVFEVFQEQFLEESSHPNMAKRFGLALGLREDEFDNVQPIYECTAHTGSIVRGMLLGGLAENRTSALTNESMVQRYSEEFATYLRKSYDLPEEALEFFVVHGVADIAHTQAAADIVARNALTAQVQERVREVARQQVRFKIAKFDGLYEAYA